MRQLYLLASIICMSFFTAYGSGDFREGTDRFSDDLFTGKKTESEKKLFWERSEEVGDRSLFADQSFSGDDGMLYGPPPGESGNPQKVASLGDDLASLLVLSFFSIGYFFVRKRSGVILSGIRRYFYTDPAKDRRSDS